LAAGGRIVGGKIGIREKNYRRKDWKQEEEL